MNIEKLREKVEAAEQKVEKCKQTIKRHKAQMEKKAEALRKIGIDPEASDKYSFVQNGSEMNREAYWLLSDYDDKKDDIKGAVQKLEDAERISANWKEKLDIEINKEKVIQDTVPQVIKDFLEKWKTDAFDWYVDRYDKFLKFRSDLRAEERAARLEAYHTLPEYAETRERHKLFLGDKEPDDSTLLNMYPRKPMEEFLKERELDYKTIQERIHNFCDNIIFKMLEFRDKDKRMTFLDEVLEQEKKSKLLSLINSVTAITGPITDAKHLYASAGDLNGVILGEKGVAKIQTFSAGGYNIQCFHFRTRVDDVTDKYKDSSSLYENLEAEHNTKVCKRDDTDVRSNNGDNIDVVGLVKAAFNQEQAEVPSEQIKKSFNSFMTEFKKTQDISKIDIEATDNPSLHKKDERICTYQFPRFEGGDDDVARDYGLEVVSNTKDDTTVKGQYRDILAFADNYLGYQLVPEYLKEVCKDKVPLDKVIKDCEAQVKKEFGTKDIDKGLEI